MLRGESSELVLLPRLVQGRHLWEGTRDQDFRFVKRQKYLRISWP
jgi:hypothetical protein